MTEAQATFHMNEFLADHPEHIQGVRVIGGSTALDALAMIAFGRWSIRKGRGARKKCEEMLDTMKHRLESNGQPWPKEVVA